MPDDNSSLKNNILSMLEFPFFIKNERDSRKIERFSEKQLTDALVRQSKYGLNTLKLMVAYKKAKLAQRNITWNCHVTSYTGLGTLLEDHAASALKPGEHQRLQVMVQCLTHINNVDIDIRGTEKGNRINLVVLDAADCFIYHTMKRSLDELKQNNPDLVENVFWTSEAIQRDELSCIMFAFKIASALRKEEHFHSFLKTIASKDGEVKWSDFPLHFLKLCQYRRFLDYVKSKEYPSEERLMDRFIRDVAVALKGGETHLLEEVFEKYRKKGLDINALGSLAIEFNELLSKEFANPTTSPIRPKVHPNAAFEKINNKGETLDSYFENHGAFFNDDSEKLHNIAAMDAYIKYSEALKIALENISEDDLPKIISGEIPFPLESVRLQNRNI